MYQSVVGKSCIHQNRIRPEKPYSLYDAEAIRKIRKQINDQISQQSAGHSGLILRNHRQQHGHSGKKDRCKQVNSCVHPQHLSERIRKHGPRLYQLQHFPHAFHPVNKGIGGEYRKKQKECRCHNPSKASSKFDQIQFFLSVSAAQQKLIHVICRFSCIDARQPDSRQEKDKESKYLKGFEQVCRPTVRMINKRFGNLRLLAAPEFLSVSGSPCFSIRCFSSCSRKA